MGLEEIIPVIFLIAVLILVFPEFLRLNSKSEWFFKNLAIWSLIIICIITISYFIFEI